MGDFGAIGRAVRQFSWSKVFRFLSLAAGTAAVIMARGSSPAFLPGQQAWRGSNWQYGLVLIAWSAVIGVFPKLCRALRRPLPTVLAVAVIWTAYQVGFNMLPIGGYDFYARISLYFYSFLSGVAFAVSCSLAAEEKLGELRSTRIAACVTLVFTTLCLMFAGAQEGVLATGPAWPSALTGEAAPTRIKHHVLYERPFPSPLYVAVQPEVWPRGSGVAPVVVVSQHGEGVVIDLNTVTVTEFDLKEPLGSELLGAGEHTYAAYMEDLTLTFPAPGKDSATLGIEGRTSISSWSGSRIPEADFLVDVGLQGPTAGTVTLISAQPGSELSCRGKFDEPTVGGVRVLRGCVIEPVNGRLRLAGSIDGVTLLAGDQVVWHLKVPLQDVRSDGAGALWAVSTPNGGLVFAIDKREWRDPNSRGCYAGYTAYTVYYVGPRLP